MIDPNTGAVIHGSIEGVECVKVEIPRRPFWQRVAIKLGLTTPVKINAKKFSKIVSDEYGKISKFKEVRGCQQ